MKYLFSRLALFSVLLTTSAAIAGEKEDRAAIRELFWKEQKGQRLIIGQGDYIITEDVIFPKGRTLVLNAGTNIYIAKNEVNISDYDFKSKVIEVISNAENIYWVYGILL